MTSRNFVEIFRLESLETMYHDQPDVVQAILNQIVVQATQGVAEQINEPLPPIHYGFDLGYKKILDNKAHQNEHIFTEFYLELFEKLTGALEKILNTVADLGIIRSGKTKLIINGGAVSQNSIAVTVIYVR